MKNLEVRNKAKESGVFLWLIAQAMGMATAFLVGIKSIKGVLKVKAKIKKIMWKDLSARWMSLVFMGKKPLFIDLKKLSNFAK